MYPDHIYIGSFDPIHYSHMNTFSVAEHDLGSLTFVVGMNALKRDALFTLEERAALVQSCMPGKDVRILHNHELFAYISNATYIVRGIRDSHDREELHRLLHYYRCEHFAGKALFIDIPTQYKNVRSSMLKRLVAGGRVEEATEMAPAIVIEAIKKRLEQSFPQANPKINL
jgi:phosphopantetheine adenylyltransferase